MSTPHKSSRDYEELARHILGHLLTSSAFLMSRRSSAWTVDPELPGRVMPKESYLTGADF